MDAIRKLLILKLDLRDEMREVDTLRQIVAQTAAGLVSVQVADCEQPEAMIAAVTDGKPDWVHIVGRSDDQQLIFAGGKQENQKIDRIHLVRNLRETAPTLTLITLNSKLDNRDLGNMGQLYAMLGMEQGYNPLASRLFMPRFYANICSGLPLAFAAKAAMEAMQQEVVQHGGIPSMCFSHTIDPETFAFLPRETVMN